MMTSFRKDATAPEVRQFGLATLGGFLLIGAILWFKGAQWSYRHLLELRGDGWQFAALVLWCTGAAFAVTSSISYAAGRKLYIAWMSVAVVMGMVTSCVLLSLMFLFLLPVFSLIRLSDPLRLKLKSTGTYWEKHSSHEATRERMSRMF